MEERYKNIHDGLIEDCLQGDRFAQAELYKLYAKAMFNIACRIVNDRDDAEDVLQEAFVNAFRNLHTYKAEASFGAWLKRIVVNKALNFVKKKKVELVPLEDHERYADEQDDLALDNNINIEHVKDAINLLPDGYRIVFSLYLLEGYDHGEIGQILGISTSTSKSQYNRSKKKLRDILEGNYERQIGTAG